MQFHGIHIFVLIGSWPLIRQGKDEVRKDRFVKKRYIFLGLLVFFLGVSIDCLVVGLEKILVNNEGAPSLKDGMKKI